MLIYHPFRKDRLAVRTYRGTLDGKPPEADMKVVQGKQGFCLRESYAFGWHVTEMSLHEIGSTARFLLAPGSEDTLTSLPFQTDVPPSVAKKAVYFRLTQHSHGVDAMVQTPTNLRCEATPDTSPGLPPRTRAGLWLANQALIELANHPLLAA